MSMTEKIGALLAKAEATSNQHEADAYLAKAQSLATAESISLAAARLAHTNKQAPETPEVRVIKIGPVNQRLKSERVFLFFAIAQANGVKVNVYSNSTAVVAYGFPNDIDATEALYNSLITQMVRGGDAHVKDPKRDRRVHGAIARRSFYEGFRSRITQRLAEANAKAKEDAAPSTTSTEIALRGRDLAVSDFYQQHSSARGSYRASYGARYSSDSARRGREHADASYTTRTDTALPGARTAIGA